MLEAQSPCSRSFGRSRVTCSGARASTTSSPAARRRSTSPLTRSNRARERSSGVTRKSYPARLIGFVTCRARPTPPAPVPPAWRSSPRHPSHCSPAAAPKPPTPPRPPPPRPRPGRPRRRPSPPRRPSRRCRSRSRATRCVTADQLYAFNPNFGADPAFEPTSSDVIAVVEEDAGTACGYLNQSSGEVIEIGVATPTEAAGETRRNNAAMSSKPVPDLRHAARRRGLLHAMRAAAARRRCSTGRTGS